MTDSQLNSALSHYKDALNELEKRAFKSLLFRSTLRPRSFALLWWLVVLSPSPEAIFNVLVARDSVRTALTKPEEMPRQELLLVAELDERLKQQADIITQSVSLDEWRTSFHAASEAWWWFLEPPLHRFDRFDWLWNALTVTSLMASLSFVVDISSKFLSVEPGFFGSFAVIAQSVLTLLTAGGTLTEAGQTAVEKGLSRLGIPTYWRQEAKLGLSVLLLLGLFGFRSYLPKISGYYNQKGLNNYVEGEWSSAMPNYERALSLDPDNVKAHYNLGRLYEDLQEFDKARTQYQLAAQGNFIAGYSDLARLYIQEQKLAEAASLLLYGLEEVEQDDELQYALWKNLGWVRLEQERWAEAETYLREAIALESIPAFQDDRPASARCLLAQVLEGKPDEQNALREWEACLRYANPTRRPEEDTWIDMARQRIDRKEKSRAVQ
ncbi:tetratricopeptide repeat protein [Lusitaniella coriacea LEGE 07157]|uniref:Tetratricopeptide repeat protein n=1 Tax=Lusitaniella coriacea LEGE 07157 TaxID=945747 RepID=A0A8J7DXM4_9CYAN|nr:tetratricopeptide repeat protein [Lusitaniella coriacea]MBE9117249.1 tetratricopeptide repeat protein [Lusitaniella coriacea LEGE 07157]